MSEITGTALRYDGLPVDYVSIFDWQDGKCIAQIKPNIDGKWKYVYHFDLEVGITYVSDGCEPLTHGAYYFTAAFSPYILFTGNQGLWFDAADSDSITVINGKVSAWNDKSGGNQHATQNTASAQPIYDAINKGVKATGIGEKLAGLFNTIDPEKINEYTMFAVVTPLKTTQSSTLESNSGTDFFNGDAAHNVFFEPRNNANVRLCPVFSATTKTFAMMEKKSGFAPSNISKDIAMAGNGRVLIGVTRDASANLKSRVFGKVQDGTKSLSVEMDWNSFNLPSQYTASSAFNGSIHELLLIHNGALGLEDLELIEVYLANKWGVSDSLVVGHPGKT